MSERTYEEKVATCTCEKCAKLCEYIPGMPTPAEAKAMIDAGLGNKLMLRLIYGSDADPLKATRVLMPAVTTSQGRFCGGDIQPSLWEMGDGGEKPEHIIDLMVVLFYSLKNRTWGRCTFLKDGLCSIHDSGFKPIQCRTATGCVPNPTFFDNFEVADLWRTKEAVAIVDEWINVHKSRLMTDEDELRNKLFDNEEDQ